MSIEPATGGQAADPCEGAHVNWGEDHEYEGEADAG